MATKDKFPKKAFQIGRLIKKYTAVLHLFKCDRVFKERPEKTKLFCKEKNCELESPFSDFLNLTKHDIKENHPISKA